MEVAHVDVAQRYDLDRPPPTSGHRYLTQPGWLRAIWMTALFFGLGFGLVVFVDWQVITVVAILTSAPIGFLAGLGAFDYWVDYALGKATKPEDHSGHGARSWKDYFRVNTDHKVIGVQYVSTTIFFFLVAGLLAMIMRAELARPGM